MSENICVVIVNYQTPDLLETAVQSFRKFYPAVSLLLTDNGSHDRSRAIITKLAANRPTCTRTVFLEKNIFHGPAMHEAMMAVDQDFVFFLDSDTETQQGGFLEKMTAEFTSERMYGVGRIDTVNRRGFHSAKGTPIILSPYMMLRRKPYFEFPPFEHRGMPTLRNFSAAQRHGYMLKSFPVETYIAHAGRGTASRYGYGLGVRGRIDYVLNKFGL
jgi:GT2 family glycosyltransferase